MPGASTIPLYPAPKRKTAVTFTLTESGSNYVRAWCTNAPPGSELRTKLDGTDDPRNRVLVYEGDGGANARWHNAFDLGGVYTFAAQEYTKNATAFGGGYQGDPDGYPIETKVGNEASITITIGERLTSEIKIGQDALTLVLWVWGGTIRATSIGVQGEVSPALLATSATPKAQVAVESTAVIALLDALAEDTVSTAVGTPSTILGNAAGGVIKEFNDHRSQAGVHSTDDTYNVIPTGLATAASADNLPDAVNEVLRFIRQHYTNDAVEAGTDPPGAGRDTGNYHSVAGLVNDNANMPLYQSVGSASEAYWALADIHRSYEAHRVSLDDTSGVHEIVDSTNTLTALPSLLALGSAIFTVWASTTPTTPATMSSGAMTLIAQAGFDLKPLET